MDRATKTSIKNLVLELRKLLEDDVEVVLKRYGIFTDREWLPVEEVPRADAQIRAERERMEAVIANEQARGISRGEATGWYVREVAFTYLNRLVGLKCLEVRGLIDEVITTRPEYGNRSLFHRDFRHDNPDLAAQPNDALPEAFEAACRIVNEEMIGVLFDPDSENSVVAPRFAALREAIGLINALPKEVWAEDEIVGWIYQFYNTEEKKQIRDRGRPELPIEVAVINQFFTPRWIVKFLVDNTLGRLWLEMHPDSERVRAKCDYLVPEPAGEQEDGSGANGDFRLDPASPVNNPKAEPRRDHKPVTEIRLIDPACGTMHFGYYAFEVFQEIYRDARERGWQIGAHPDTPPPSDVEVPALILAHNLYGVDIDLRAVQLAALSLYMKARVAEQEIDPDYRAPSYRVNLVSADARLADGELRERFLGEYEDDPRLQKVWRELFEEMEDIAQVGSLLRVEERLRQLLGEYEPESLEKGELRPTGPKGLEFGKTPRQLSLAEAPGGEQWSPRRTVDEMLAHLRDFARDAMKEADVSAQLFAAEAEKTLGLLDILIQKYEVVVMNPPYGRTTDEAKEYLKDAYPLTKNDLYAAFFSRALDILVTDGFAGALTSRTFLNLISFQDLREQIFLKEFPVVTALDLGFGILDDAFVETVATVTRSTKFVTGQAAVFFRLNSFDEKRQAHFERLVASFKQESRETDLFTVKIDELGLVPTTPFAYWAPRSLRRVFQELPALQPTAGVVKQGLATGDDDRFLRQWWEVSESARVMPKGWVPLAKGGDYCKYYYDLDLVVNWANDGHELKNHFSPSGRLKSRPQNEGYYFQEGLTYPRVTVKGFNVRRLPSGAIFGDKGPSIVLDNADGPEPWFLLGVLNSALIQTFLYMLTPSRSFEVGHVSRLPYQTPNETQNSQISQLSREAFTLKAKWDEGNEISTSFSKSWVLQLAEQDAAFNSCLGEVLTMLGDDLPPPSASLPALLKYVEEIEKRADARLEEIQQEIDQEVFDLYEISQPDRALIERELGERPPELVWPQMEGKSRKEKNREHVRRLLSYFVLESIKADADGILPVFEGTGEPTAIERLRARLIEEFGEEAAFKLEDDAGKVMGRSVENWLDGQFIKWHTRLYNKRPIIWHIASPKNNFGVFVYIHKLDRDTLRKVRNVYLRTAREGAQARLQRAREEDDQKTVSDEEDLLDELQQLDERLAAVINNEVGYKPPKWAEGPYRGGIYDPVVDDGVKVNLMPLQKGEVLRYKRMI